MPNKTPSIKVNHYWWRNYLQVRGYRWESSPGMWCGFQSEARYSPGLLQGLQLTLRSRVYVKIRHYDIFHQCYFNNNDLNTFIFKKATMHYNLCHLYNLHQGYKPLFSDFIHCFLTSLFFKITCCVIFCFYRA